MMPYATDNMICQDPVSGGIEISEGKYLELLRGMMAGQVVAIEGGEAVLKPKENDHA